MPRSPMHEQTIRMQRLLDKAESELSLSLAREQRLEEDRNDWIRLFNRLDAAVSRCLKSLEGTPFVDDAYDALHAAHDRVLRASARQGLGEHPGADHDAQDRSCKNTKASESGGSSVGEER